jgi:hypothetical protein
VNIHFDRSGSQTALATMLQYCVTKEKAQGCLILACDANGYTAQALEPILHNTPIPIFGGIFPKIIYGSEQLSIGTIVVSFPVTPQVGVIINLSDHTQNLDQLLEREIVGHVTGKTLFVFVDGLAQRIHALLDTLFHAFGMGINYIGGGAGSLSFQQKPAIITNAGLQQDCAVLAQVDIDSGVGVSHGWQTINGPFQVTSAQGNAIHTLDWRPAFDVYRESIQDISQQQLTMDNFFHTAQKYPFGIKRLGAEKIVRDPILVTPEGALVCIGEVPESAFIDILGGDVTSLVSAAGYALSLAQTAYCSQQKPSLTLFLDCVTRMLYLEENFTKELAAVQTPDIPLIGALTLGEIANSGFDYLEFHNKAAVIGILGRSGRLYTSDHDQQ